MIYVSRPLIENEDRARVFDDIQAVSIARNSMLEITGLLIATPRFFAQLLEGPARGVDTVMASILADPRHHEVRVVRRSEAAVRRYPLWRMARFDGENFGIEGITPLLAAAHARDDPEAGRRLDRLMAAIAFSRASPRI
ncbi:BLUF domain-containing protein [Novosphingobium album (ex Liu et al. 2023)]|uniref:BLUF domain-containing protein n=1 Tax=Novosphingobium album (ex Liu et al. 2023) TaxID=3031130 RepID=UPI0023B16AF1|nr:BLUF domain-containing protein [Novosphingobium album (ex Liu et al. 2023)]